MFLGLFWLLGVVFFLFLPLLVDIDNRQLWLRRLRELRWIVVTTDSGQHTSEAHLDPTQEEDEIRANFLNEKLESYTLEITPQNMTRPRTNTMTTTAEGSSSRQSSVAHVSDDEESRYDNDDDEIIDLEQGLSTGHENARNTDIDVTKRHKTSDTKDMEAKSATSRADEVFPDLVGQEEEDWLPDTDNGQITVPLAGESRHSEALKMGRQESNGCAVCLSPFGLADLVTWATNPACTHIFHEACIKDWLMASGRRYLAVQRQQAQRLGEPLPVEKEEAMVTEYPMLCPCCRQPFIQPDEASCKAVAVGGQDVAETATDQSEAVVTLPIRAMQAETTVNSV